MKNKLSGSTAIDMQGLYKAIQNAVLATQGLTNANEKLVESQKKVSDASKKQKTSQSQLKTLIGDLSKSTNEMNTSIKSINTQLANLSTRVKSVEDKIKNGAVNGVKTEFKNLDDALKSVNVSTADFKNKFNQIGTSVTNGTKVTTTYVDVNNRQLKVIKDLNGETATYSVTLNTLNTNLSKNVKTMSNMNAKYLSYAEVQKKLGVNLETSFTKMSSSVDANGNVLEKWTNNVGKVVTISGTMVDGNMKYTGSLKEVNEAVDANAKQADKWKYSWSKAFQSFTTYMTVTQVFYTTINGIKDMINEVVELDSALVELQKVTVLEGESLQGFTEEAYRAADAVAKTGTEMISAATEFAKAGYDESEILKLGELALMYTNIADEQVSAAEASEFMIAQMKAFNIEANNATHIIDAVNEVSNKFAVSSADIANNIGNSSAVMANAGNSLEQTIGLLAAGTEITRSASKVSNGLKTITLRLQGMNDEGEEDLELVAKMEELYKKLGISVYNASGDLKNTFELLQSLAEVYPTLTAAEKAYVTETIAGKYQAQNAAAILSNFQTALEATETAYNSTGSAMEENNKVLESIKGKVSNFQSAFEQLSTTVVNSDLIKFIVDLGTALLKFANSDATRFITQVMLISASFKALNVGFSAIEKFFANSKIFSGLSKNIKLLQDYYKYSKMASQTTKVLGDGFEMTSGSVTALTTAEQAQVLVDGKLLASKLALNAVLGATALVLTTAITLWRKHQQEQQEAVQQTIDDANALDTKTSELDNLATKIQQLREITDNSNSSYQESIDARKELMDIQNDLIKNYGAEADKIDLVSGSIETQIDYLKKLRQEAAQDYLDSNKNNYETAKSKVDKQHRITQSDIMGEYNNFGSSLLYYGLNKDYSTVLTDRKNDINGGKWFSRTGSYDELATQLDDAAKYLEENRDKIAEYYGVKIEDINTEIEKIKAKAKEYSEKNPNEKEAISAYNEKELTAAGYDSFKEKLLDMSETGIITKQNIQDLINEYPNLDKALENNDITVEKLLKEFQNLNTVYNTLLANNEGLAKFMGDITLDGNVTEEEVNKLKEAFPDLQKQIEDTGFTFEDFINNFPTFVFSSMDSLSALSEELDNIQSAFDITKAALEEYNEAGYFSVDTLQQLLTLEPQYLDALIDENGVIRDNISVFKTLTEAKLDEMQATEDDRYLKELNRLATMSEAEATQLAAASIDAHNQAMAGQEVNAAALREQIQKNIQAFNEEAAAALRAAEAENEAKHNRTNSLIENSRKGLSSGSYSSSSHSPSSSSSKEWWETELEKLKDQFNYNEITIQEYINGLSNLLGKVSEGTDAWREINEELQKQRLDKVEDDYKRGTISLDEYIKKLKELIKTYKKGTDAWNDLADAIKEALQDKADQQKDDLETAEEAALEIIDREIDKLNELKKEKEDYYDQLIKDKEEANEESEKELELARLQEALENARKEKTKRVWREGLGKKSAKYKGNYIGQMLGIVQTEVRLCLGGALWV